MFHCLLWRLLLLGARIIGTFIIIGGSISGVSGSFNYTSIIYWWCFCRHLINIACTSWAKKPSRSLSGITASMYTPPQAFQATRRTVGLLGRPEELPDGSLLQHVLPFGDIGSLHSMDAQVLGRGAPARHFSSPLPERSCSPWRVTDYNLPTHKTRPLRERSERSRCAEQQQPEGGECSRQQTRTQSPAAHQQQHTHQHFSPGEEGGPDASAAVARIRAMLEAHTDAAQCIGSPVVAAAAPPSTGSAANRSGRPLVRLQVPERIEAPASLSAPPPSAPRGPQGEAQVDPAVSLPPGLGLGGEGFPGILVSAPERIATGGADGWAGGCEGLAGAAGARHRSESAGPPTCESLLPQRPSRVGGISMSIRSREGGLVLQGRFVPNTGGQWLGSPRDIEESVGTHLGTEPESRDASRLHEMPVPHRQDVLALGAILQERHGVEQALQPQISCGLAVAGSGGDDAQASHSLGVGALQERGITAPWEPPEPRDAPLWEQGPSLTPMDLPSYTSSVPQPPQLESPVEAYGPQLAARDPACQDLITARGQAPDNSDGSAMPPLTLCAQHGTLRGQQQLYDPRPQPPPRDGHVPASGPCVPTRPPSLSMAADRLSHSVHEYTARTQGDLLPDIPQQDPGMQHLFSDASRLHRRGRQEPAGGESPRAQRPLPLHNRINAARGSQAPDVAEAEQLPRQQQALLQQVQQRQRRLHQQYSSATEGSRTACQTETVLPSHTRGGCDTSSLYSGRVGYRAHWAGSRQIHRAIRDSHGPLGSYRRMFHSLADSRLLTYSVCLNLWHACPLQSSLKGLWRPAIPPYSECKQHSLSHIPMSLICDLWAHHSRC